MKLYRQPPRALIDADDKVIMTLWRDFRLNTKEIADRLKLEEYQVELRLHQLKDQERSERSA